MTVTEHSNFPSCSSLPECTTAWDLTKIWDQKLSTQMAQECWSIPGDTPWRDGDGIRSWLLGTLFQNCSTKYLGQDLFPIDGCCAQICARGGKKSGVRFFAYSWISEKQFHADKMRVLKIKTPISSAQKETPLQMNLW
jgi:hypothetical protein